MLELMEILVQCLSLPIVVLDNISILWNLLNLICNHINEVNKGRNIDCKITDAN